MGGSILTSMNGPAMRNLPSALTHQTSILQRISGKRIAVFLDYDGTLAPIVDSPALAYISEEMRGLLQELSNWCPTTIVSGRSVDTLKKFVRLKNIYYVGSHGFHIVGPAPSGLKRDAGKGVASVVGLAHDALLKETGKIRGVIIEHAVYTVSIHYRLVDYRDISLVEAAVSGVLMEYPDLQITSGKMVYEVRPRLDWDKGKAVLWLLEALGLNSHEVVTFYLGDDTTDEDAFRAVRSFGIGVLVSDTPKETFASYSLKDTRGVQEFLRQMLAGISGKPS